MSPLEAQPSTNFTFIQASLIYSKFHAKNFSFHKEPDTSPLLYAVSLYPRRRRRRKSQNLSKWLQWKVKTAIFTFLSSSKKIKFQFINLVGIILWNRLKIDINKTNYSRVVNVTKTRINGLLCNAVCLSAAVASFAKSRCFERMSRLRFKSIGNEFLFFPRAGRAIGDYSRISIDCWLTVTGSLKVSLKD